MTIRARYSQITLNAVHLTCRLKWKNMKNIASLMMMFVLVVAFTSGARAATWYQQAYVGDWNNLNSWYSQPLGGGTHPTSISPSDDFDLNGFRLNTPGGSSGTFTFGGHALILHGGQAGSLVTKSTPPAIDAVGTLISYGGIISNGNGGTQTFNITTFQNYSNTTLSAGSPRGLSFNIGTLLGGGDISAIGSTSGGTGGSVLMNVTTAAAFTGTLYIADGCQFTFLNAMTSGGALDVEGSATAVVLNATVTFKGLTINGVAKAPGTYTAASLGAPFSGTGSVVVQTPATSTFSVTQNFGVNFSGGESSNRNYPTKANYWTYYHGKGLNLIRVPFSWEAVQPTLGGTLNPSALASLDTVVGLAATNGMQVILDMHNYGRYTPSGGTSTVIGTSPVTYANYQQVWQLLAAHFAAKTGIYGYDIMNEPHDNAGTWVSTAAQYGVNGVRQGDTTHYVIVEGDSYAGAQGWMSVNANLNITDSANKLIYSAHTYWDSNNSGTYSGTYDSNNEYPNIGVDRVAPFVHWLSLKGAKGLVGEFGVPNNVASPDYRWNNALDNFLYYINNNGIDGTYWGTYNLSATYPLRPNTDSGTTLVDAPAMSVLQTYGNGMAWAKQDIGAVSPAGSYSRSGGTFTLNTGSGSELMVAGTADVFTYVYLSVSSVSSITARVATLSANDGLKGEGGVMIRNDLTTGSAFALSGVTTGRGVQFTYRASAGATSASATGSNVVAPYWVRLTRSGNTFTGYQSVNGTTWVQVGTPQTLTMGTSVYIGLPICNHGGTATATVDNVSIAP